MLVNVGGSAESVLAAAALRCLGGEILCRWQPKDQKHIDRLHKEGVTNFRKVFDSNDLAKGKDVSFTATGVMSGPLADGVVFATDHITTHSVVMSSNPHSIRFITAKHML